MHIPKDQSHKQKQKRPPVDWDGLGNEPRDENLARVRGPTSFEKVEDDQDKKSRPNLSYRLNKQKGRNSLSR